MGILADWQIEAAEIFHPFTGATGQRREGAITHGASSYGYDVRAGHVFQVFSNVIAADGIIDPKNFNQRMLQEVDTHQPIDEKGTLRNYCLIPPNSFCLCYTVEEVHIPRDCLGVVVGKSTYARCGLVVNCTPLEPSWRGHVTMEISNTTPLPAKVYADEGVAQVLLLRADGVNLALLTAVRKLLESHPEMSAELEANLKSLQCQTSYADKKGRYQNQGATVTMPCARGQEARGV